MHGEQSNQGKRLNELNTSRDFISNWRAWHRNRDDSDISIARNLLDPLRSRVLEIGCGDGRITLALAPHCRQIIGIDLDPRLIAAAKHDASESKCVNVTFEQMNAEHLAYESLEFDRVIFAWSLHMMANPRQAVRQAYRVLAPRGLLVVIGLLSEGVYDGIIDTFAPQPSICPTDSYLEPIRESFGASGLRSMQDYSFDYFFDSLDSAVAAFAFAFSEWYHKRLNQSEIEKLRQLLSEFLDGERIRIQFPATVFIAQKE